MSQPPEPSGQIVVCGPPSAAVGLPQLEPVHDTCRICKDPLVYSVSTAAHVRTGQLVPLCHVCGTVAMIAQGGTVAATKETLDALDRIGMRQEFQAHLDSLNRRQ